MRKVNIGVVIARQKPKQSIETKSNFSQNIWLIIVGAMISFVSTIGTSFIATRNESRKLTVEQKILFEKELSSTIATNMAIVERIIFKWRNDSARADTSGQTDCSRGFTKEYRPWGFRTTSTELMMTAYVDEDLCRRYAHLNDSLSIPASLAIENWSRRGADYVKGWSSGPSLYIRIQNEYAQFIKDFHTAILK